MTNIIQEKNNNNNNNNSNSGEVSHHGYQNNNNIICEGHKQNLCRYGIDETHCLQLVRCFDCNSQRREIWTVSRWYLLNP
jgi:hypothetical protein